MRQCPPKELIKAGEIGPDVLGAAGARWGAGAPGPPPLPPRRSGRERRSEREGRGRALAALRGDGGRVSVSVSDSVGERGFGCG